MKEHSTILGQVMEKVAQEERARATVAFREWLLDRKVEAQNEIKELDVLIRDLTPTASKALRTFDYSPHPTEWAKRHKTEICVVFDFARRIIERDELQKVLAIIEAYAPYHQKSPHSAMKNAPGEFMLLWDAFCHDDNAPDADADI